MKRAMAIAVLLLAGCSRSPVDIVGTVEVKSVSIGPIYVKSGPDVVRTSDKREIDNLLRGFRDSRVSEERYAGNMLVEVEIAFVDGNRKSIIVFSEPTNMIAGDDLYFCDLSSFMVQWKLLCERKEKGG